MSDYKKLVVEEAKQFLGEHGSVFDEDSDEFGGQSSAPNLPKWLDKNRKLFDRLDGVTKAWGRAEFEMVQANSRHSVAYGDPRENSYFAFYKDIVAELKKLRKKQHGV